MKKVNLSIQKFKQTKGQGLVEVLVAIGILTAIVISVLSLAAMTIKLGTLSEEKTQAMNLAQQGIEVVRNIRDNNWKSGATNWDESFISDGWYKIDYDSTQAKWSLSSGPPSGVIVDGFFTRKIRINNATIATSVPAKEITVWVKWRNDTKEVKLTSYLTDWKPKP